MRSRNDSFSEMFTNLIRSVHPLLRLFTTHATRLCLIAIAVGTPMRLRAELKWDATKIELAPTVFDATAEAGFKFVNAGDKAVSIESVRPSCECTVARLEKKRYASGERGEIVAHFDFGDRKGTQNVTIQITIDGQREPVTLSLTVKIPVAARIDPVSLLWAIGEPNTPKTVTVEAVAGQPLRVEKVLASNADFDTRLETIREDAEYHIVVTPKSTDHPMITLLNIDARLNDRPRRCSPPRRCG